MTVRILALVGDAYGARGGIARYNRDLFGALAATGAEILVLPIYLNDHLVAMFYGDCGDYEGIRVETEHYRRAMIKLAYAFTLLQLKQKIRSI